MPAAQAAFRAWQFEIRNQLAAILLQEGVFSSVGDDLTVYARYRDRDGTLRGILVHDARERGAPVTILAEAGAHHADAHRPARDAAERRAPAGGARAAPAERRPGQPATRLIGAELHREQRRPRARRTRQRRGQPLPQSRRSAPQTNCSTPIPRTACADRDLRRFRAEAHQRLASPLTALAFALVALAVALTGEFRRHGGGLRLVRSASRVVVGLLAVGLTTGNLAARAECLGPADLAATRSCPCWSRLWVMVGMPGLPRPRATPCRRRRRHDHRRAP